MTLQDIGAIGELIGAIAVVLSLLYLAAQIRVNSQQIVEQSKALNLSSLNAVEESFSRFRIPIMSDPVTANLWQLAMTDYKAIPEDQKAQADMMLWEYFYCWANFLTRIENGIVTAEGAQDRVRSNIIRNIKESRGIEPWWKENRAGFRPSFVEIVDEGFRDND